MTQREKNGLFIVLATMLPFIFGAISLYAQMTEVFAEVKKMQMEREDISDKLNNIAEKLNIIDGKLQEHFRKD